MVEKLCRLSLLGLWVAAWALPVAALDVETLHTFEREFSPHDIDEVSIDVPVGEVLVDAGDVDRIRVFVDVRCRKSAFRRGCERRAERVELADELRGGRLDLEIEGLRAFGGSGMQIHTVVTLPAHLDVRVDLRLGDVEVRGVQGSLVVDLGIGEATIGASGGDVVVDVGIGDVSVEVYEKSTEEVHIDLGIGESVLIHPDGQRVRAGVIGGENEWTGGRGAGDVRVDLGIGAVRVEVH